MPTVPVRIVWMLVGLIAGAVPSGCVTMYDPSTRNQYSLESRAAETGQDISRQDSLRITPRASRAAAKTEPTKSDRFSPERRLVAVPETPAGKQLSWLMQTFNGGNVRQIKQQFSPVFLGRTREERARATLIEWRRDEFADGPADLYQIEDSGPNRVAAIVRGRATDRYSRVVVTTDKDGRILTLSLSPLLDFKPGDLSDWPKIDAKLNDLGQVGLAVHEIGPAGLIPIHTFKADQALSIGEVAGLYVAGALTEAVVKGTAQWQEPFQISDDLKSLMGGRMQLEMPETEFPLAQYLSLMLATGDTTAFDHLLARVGRDKVEDYMSRFCSQPQRNKPFLATMEYFRLKLGSDRKLPAAYAVAGEAERRAMLRPKGPADQSIPSLSAAGNWRLPFEIERIGWFASADDCCRVIADMYRVSRQPKMEPLANALRMTDAFEPWTGPWKTVAFKSGTEPGVLAMVWLLERNDGRTFVLSMIANDPKQPVSQSDLNECAAAAVRLLRENQTKK